MRADASRCWVSLVFRQDFVGLKRQKDAGGKDTLGRVKQSYTLHTVDTLIWATHAEYQMIFDDCNKLSTKKIFPSTPNSMWCPTPSHMHIGEQTRSYPLQFSQHSPCCIPSIATLTMREYTKPHRAIAIEVEFGNTAATKIELQEEAMTAGLVL